MFRFSAACFLLGLGVPSALFAQAKATSPPASIVKGREGIAVNSCTNQAGLACVIPNLYGPYGFVLPSSFHAAHFNSAFQTSFNALNSAVATQLTLLPLASPASGFTYEFDSSTGVYTRSAETFGPVLTERAETIGRHKFHFGGSFQRFRFDKIDGIPLGDVPAVFNHEEGTGTGLLPKNPTYEQQFISTDNSLDLKINQFTFFANYGVTDHIDVSIAVPLLEVALNANSFATINRIAGTELKQGPNGPKGPPVCCSTDNGPTTVYTHFFDPKDQAGSLQHIFSNDPAARRTTAFNPDTDALYSNPSRNSASGLGDIIFRFKAGVLRSDRVSLALLTDLRIPTGDERNFLGSGAYGVKPFAALSIRTGRLVPHVNLGYQWNGSSLLNGNITAGTKNTLPGFAFLSVGTDLGVSRRLTLAVDYLGQELINAPTVSRSTYSVPSGQVLVMPHNGSFPTITEQGRTYNQSNAAFGFKYNLFGQLLLTGNMLVALNDGGLRERVVPLIGLSYAF